jgi:hypothetical protein
MTPSFWAFLGALIPLLSRIYDRMGDASMSLEEEHAMAMDLIRAVKDARARENLR